VADSDDVPSYGVNKAIEITLSIVESTQDQQPDESLQWCWKTVKIGIIHPALFHEVVLSPADMFHLYEDVQYSKKVEGRNRNQFIRCQDGIPVTTVPAHKSLNQLIVDTDR
jgi:hypothetical protein